MGRCQCQTRCKRKGLGVLLIQNAIQVAPVTFK
jgi:hypothetical protein